MIMHEEAEKKIVHVIGMGLSPRDLTQSHLDLIHQAQVLVGGRRHLETFSHIPAMQREIIGPISEVLEFIREKMDTLQVVVLASGDPLFFGIGKTLVDHLGPDRVVIHPNITSMAAAFARLKLPWQEASWVSLHGKKEMASLETAMNEKSLFCVFTDPANNPDAIAQTVGAHNMPWNMWVLERLGTPDEKITLLDPAQTGTESYAQPNVVVLKKKEWNDPPGPLRLGTPDHWFVHEKGLITKAPVRAVVLSMLRLEKHHTLWDLGAGSGSVGLEATLLLTQGLVYAVEKNAERIRQIRANAEKFKVKNLTAVHIDMPDGLDRLPRPHRVFIGGGGNALPGILEKAAVFLEHGDLIVVNAVLLETLTMAVKRLEEMKFKTSVTQIQVSQSRKMPWGQYMESLNPVWIIVGEKEK